MNARGSTEVIVATIGLSMGVLSQRPVHDDRHHGGRHDDGDAADAALGARPAAAQRGGSRAARDARSSRNAASSPISSGCCSSPTTTNEGKFAARIAGLLAGLRGMPVTLLQAQDDKEQAERRTAKVNRRVMQISKDRKKKGWKS